MHNSPLDVVMKFRPGDLPEGDPSEDGTPVEWEDNWLSNSMAWVSHKLLPNWCQHEDHWTARVTQYLFTDCPCCMLFRGLTIGFAVGISFLAMTLALVTLVLLAVS